MHDFETKGIVFYSYYYFCSKKSCNHNIHILSIELQPVFPNVTITSNDVRIRRRKLVVVNAGETFKLKCAVSSWMPNMNIEVEWRKLEGQMLKNTRLKIFDLNF